MDSQQWNPTTSVHIHDTGREVESDEDLTRLIGERDRTFHLQNLSATPKPSDDQPLGQPTQKKRLNLLDALAVGLSLICLALAILVVANTKVSWLLAGKNRQLIVIGFLLSIMNLCLGSILPTIFLLIEARFGPSRLQNYDAIIRNRPLASRLSMMWRVALGTTLAIPIGLSAAYKTFDGGESAFEVDSRDYISNVSYYGMYPPPNLLSLASNTGIPLYFNATLPFLTASSILVNDSSSSQPTYPQVYGYSILSQSNDITAILDIPQSQYITAIQDLLAIGESWKVTAPVTATVSTLNKTNEPTELNSQFRFNCELSQEEAESGNFGWTLTTTDMYTGWQLIMLEPRSLSNQSTQYIGMGPGLSSNCSELSKWHCQGSWSITRGGIELVKPSCNGTALPHDLQHMIDNNEEIATWYQSTLMQTIGSYSGGGPVGNQSAWRSPSITTAMAAMVWARVSALNTPRDFDNTSTLQYPGMVYPVDHTVLYIRPVLRKTGLLYLVLAIQPILIGFSLLLKAFLHSTPLDKGFGLVSILSDVKSYSLDHLTGATLSGDLTQPVKLEIQPIQNGRHGLIEYRVVASPKGIIRNGKLNSKVIYH